jgi:hypothetical protein
MSDTTRPTNPEDQSTFPHSGSKDLPDSVREKHPTGDFDNTALEEPYKTGALTPPDSPATLPEFMPPITEQVVEQSSLADKRKSHRGLIIGGTIAALAGVAGLLVSQSGGGSEPTEKSRPAPAEASPHPDAPTTIAPLNPNAAPAVEQKTNSDSISVTRANHEKVTVSRLPDHVGSTQAEINKYAETANELLALFYTTGDEGVLDAITPSDALKADLRTFRNRDFIEPYRVLQSYPTHDNFQMIIGNDSEHPLNYQYVTNDDGSREIVAPDLVRFQFSDDPKWQSTKDSTDSWTPLRLKDLRYRITPDGEGKDIISGTFWTTVK